MFVLQVTGNKDRVTQQINQKLGDYDLAQVLLEDPSKSIGICHEPPSPAPCEYHCVFIIINNIRMMGYCIRI